MTCLDEQSETSGGKQVDFGDTSTSDLLIRIGALDPHYGKTSAVA